MKRKWWVVGGLILAEVALCAGIVIVAWAGIAQLRASGVRWRVFDVNSVSAEANEEQRRAVDGPATLVVENGVGAISVTGGPGSEVVVGAHRVAWGADQADAEAALASLNVSVTQSGNTVTVRVEQPVEVDLIHIGPGGSRVDFTIAVPAETSVTLSSRAGDIALSGVEGTANLHSDFGGIRVSGLSGGLQADSGNGAIEARRVEAGSAGIDLRSEFGAITLERSSAGEVNARSSNGRITLAAVEATGDIALASNFGRIQFDTGRAASLSAQSDNGEVGLTGLGVDAGATVRSDFGSLTLERVAAASYDLISRNGSITLDGAGGAIKAQTSFGGVSVTGAQGANLDLQSGNGAVEFQGSLGPGPHRLKSEFGSVRLALPRDTALSFDLHTQHGRITSDFPVTIDGALDESHWQGTINGGGASLTVATANGGISLNHLEP